MAILAKFLCLTAVAAGCIGNEPVNPMTHESTEPPMATPADVQIRHQAVEYTVGGQTFEGYVGMPSSDVPGPYPVILIVHDWNGLDDHERDVANRLARHGYLAFAVDVFGKGVRPTTREACSAEVAKYYGNPTLWHQRMEGSLRAARSQSSADPVRAGAIGYCFGGTGVLEMARQGMPVQAVASFHGGLKGPSKAQGKLGVHVLEFHGEADPMVPAEDVKAFEAEMKAAKANYKSIGFAGAGHAFAVKGSDKFGIKGVGYDKKADQTSWGLMLSFMNEHVRGK